MEEKILTEDVITTNVPEFDEEPQIPRTACQLGLLVLDGSGSMSGSKADEVNKAGRGLLNRLLASGRKRDIDIAIVNFDHKASTRLEVTPVFVDEDNTIQPNENFDPTIGHGGGTSIVSGLKEAQKIAEEYINNPPIEGLPTTVVVMVMSDGASHDDPIPIAGQIKQNQSITICSCHFGQPDSNTEKTLRGICNDQVTGYTTVYDALTLRKFFLASMQSAGVKIN